MNNMNLHGTLKHKKFTNNNIRAFYLSLIRDYSLIATPILFFLLSIKYMYNAAYNIILNIPSPTPNSPFIEILSYLLGWAAPIITFAMLTWSLKCILLHAKWRLKNKIIPLLFYLFLVFLYVLTILLIFNIISYTEDPLLIAKALSSSIMLVIPLAFYMIFVQWPIHKMVSFEPGKYDFSTKSFVVSTFISFLLIILMLGFMISAAASAYSKHDFKIPLNNPGYIIIHEDEQYYYLKRFVFEKESQSNELKKIKIYKKESQKREKESTEAIDIYIENIEIVTDTYAPGTNKKLDDFYKKTQEMNNPK